MIIYKSQNGKQKKNNVTSHLSKKFLVSIEFVSYY